MAAAPSFIQKTLRCWHKQSPARGRGLCEAYILSTQTVYTPSTIMAVKR